MSQKHLSTILIILTLMVSVGIMIVPSFFTKGISRVTLNKEIHLPSLIDGNKSIDLVFFGYSGCKNICTPRLESLAKFYNSLEKPIQRKVGVAFIDISTPEDTTLPQRFASYFHLDFKGIYLNSKNSKHYARAFDVFYSRSLLDKNEYNHTANLYLITKQGQQQIIRYMYIAYPYDYEQIKLDIQRFING